jgi:uncharacterized protein
MTDPSSRRRFLGAALTTTAAFGSSSAIISLLSGCGASVKAPETAVGGAKLSTTLIEALDATTGKALLKLPPGFRYFSFAWAGERLADGSVTPGGADGMGLIHYGAGKARFIRNQEIWDDPGAFALHEHAYDLGAGAGTVTIDVDLDAGTLIQARASLAGTNANCSGGRTPWGSWLSGEEQVVADGEILISSYGAPMTKFQKPHGFIFEVPGLGATSAMVAPARASFRPIVEMGQMRHEAAAVDPETGIVYLTEDNNPAAGFYRFIPRKLGDLSAGGALEMLAVMGTQELRRGMDARAGTKFKTRWVRILDPSKAHADSTRASNGCFDQGFALGGASFSRLEGIYCRAGEIFFTSTNGGDIAQGQVFVYRPKTAELELVYESTDKQVMNFPDAIETGPAGGHIICQDGKEVFPQVLYFLSKAGKVTPIAQNNLDDPAGKYSEWSGCSMSPDGKWLFANVYTPGFTVAITGPFERWAAAI